ncbi:NAD(P)H-dependent oxidoreductase subunit E [Aporhodopirellula aestuarii]|uniref:NAD(P)H-dependent oxidoreductase subunit E n=1 Tax=Aporhodopirellula aestuarii TaxID=2950107 RepID=A0ABT0UCP9_9BACT|nr:NAD(P)H-dependent oxidoreductase subunit E [Aporhodopirellula aestuarii]MCM2374626.1 NAD(P)H-dependent oxidoreductase subunit E [Aporhodopirellula aestuarii]
MIIPALHERQHQRGYLTRSDLVEIAQECNVPLYRVNEVVSFFPHFRTSPPPKVVVDVCRDMACHLRGSVPMVEQLSAWAKNQFGDHVEVRGVSCLGRCDRAPAAMINEKLYACVNGRRIEDAVLAGINDRKTPSDSDWDTAKPNQGKWDIDPYGGEGKYDIVRRYVTKGGTPDEVIAALEKAGLLGMGGAGGRAYLKWSDVREAKASNNQKYVVCNADESEPGTFKDRDILLAAPHTVIEGMILAGLVVGANQGWIYVRHEYPEQIERCRAEIKRAEELGALGTGIFNSKSSMKLEVFPSPGGYICGEQTALIEAMENKRAEPRNRPPELMTNGLHDQPTLLSNVETFAWVPAILKDSGDWFASQGERTGPMTRDLGESIKGKRLFSISGDVKRPGVYEVATGITLGELIDTHCQGMLDGQAIAAVALSGPSGGLLPAKIPIEHLNRRGLENCIDSSVTHIDIRDLPLDIQVSRVLGYMLGAGIVVYGDKCDLLAEAVANSRFYRNESCGKCVPCRLGSKKITDMGERLLAADVDANELTTMYPVIMELSAVMQATSICGLGQVASNPLQSFLKYFPHLAEDACRKR